jgi:thioredoxin-dependent peroxiredoxin
MKSSVGVHGFLLGIMTLSILAVWPGGGGSVFANGGKPPDVVSLAPDFELASTEGNQVRLSQELKAGPVVLILLRGWPGYQCPFCTRQFGDFLSHAKDLAGAGATVLFVYPGPSDNLREHAEQFKARRRLPPNFRFLVDPDYKFTNAYGLRWEKEGETSYPATFVIDRGGTVRYALISDEHGGRAPAADVLKALSGLTK